ncbi:8-amino-7-oxononanoate synthase [Campylobacter sp. 19-13652]|uniref:aminotransferase class I/II-fold pyridoxal phosphate-dependent enzyme n=1 Tax=Campylobacter sp. 19-13652 TaxID=2840180 RepID=UPI001C768A34|nr:8-amino-7-oxononanoate synthase [Campylobacter sp. 19-13652]BCX79847.1 8-amino-7-oxononanoate synthase [Campylobacter sp. 19-13652]
MQKIKKILLDLKESSNLRTLSQLIHDGAYITKDGKRLLNLASNDYLGLGASDELFDEFLDTTSKKSLKFSASSSRSLSGNFEIFSEFESFLAKSYGDGKSALLFNSGYHLNVGVISALASLKNTLFIIDRQAHASAYDGLRLGGASFERFRHNDTAHIKEILDKNSGKFERFIIITEALFSMDGDEAPLGELGRIKSEHEGVWLYVDEAHSVGACGHDGLGLCKDSGVDVDFVVFTFGKAICSMGAALICDETVREFLINRARSLIYSTAIAPINVAFTHFIFKKLGKMKQKRAHLQSLSDELKVELKKHGAQVLGSRYIISVLAGSSDSALKMAARLQHCGYFAPAVRPPTVAPNTARVRLSLCANMQKDELLGVVNAL